MTRIGIISKIKELPFVKEVVQEGGEIFLVGGAVRDQFLGLDPKDLDILIRNIPLDTLEIILSKHGKVDAVGKSFGILIFKRGVVEIEIAIPRKDRDGITGGHKDVQVESNHLLAIEEDLKRRDLTINAIAMDLEGKHIDPFNGVDDVKNGIIRAVTTKSFTDDPLRMLRSVQFASRFGFTIERQTFREIAKNASQINLISGERILLEFQKMVGKGDVMVGVKNLVDTGLFKHIFGSKFKGDVSDFENVKTLGEFFFMLTKDIMERPSVFFMTRLGGDKDTNRKIKALRHIFDKTYKHKWKNRVVCFTAKSICRNVLKSGILPKPFLLVSKELESGRFPSTYKELDINGDDLLNLGFKGKKIGEALKLALWEVFKEKITNNKSELIKFVTRLK